LAQNRGIPETLAMTDYYEPPPSLLDRLISSGAWTYLSQVLLLVFGVLLFRRLRVRRDALRS
jgi:hypothetical protein